MSVCFTWFVLEGPSCSEAKAKPSIGGNSLSGDLQRHPDLVLPPGELLGR